MGVESKTTSNGVQHSNPGIDYDYIKKRKNNTKWQNLKLSIWDPEEKAFLGRTARRWRNIGLIYLVMYICIIIFFSMNMCGLLATMDETVPYFILKDSIIGANPGMGHRPMIYDEGSLIFYKAENRTQVQKYTGNIRNFLKPYVNMTTALRNKTTEIKCNNRTSEGCSQIFDLNLLGECNSDNEFLYPNSTPCFLVKLNKIYGWKPEYYDDPNDFPEDMPQDLRDFISSLSNPLDRKKVWISCFGERPGDNEVVGNIAYHPWPGFSSEFFPYMNQPGYLSPLVAVHLLNPARGQIINIRCRSWAKNLIYTPSLKDRPASTHIEIMID